MSIDDLRRIATTDPIEDGALAKAVTASTVGDVVQKFSLDEAAAYREALSKLTTVLNDQECGIKKRTNALVTLANFAKVKAARSDLFDAVKKLDTSFEKLLIEKEKGQESFGVNLGKLHETMLVLLMRVFSYRMRGSELLEFTNGRVPFAVTLVLGIMKVPSYEEEVVANCCSLLNDLSHPASFFGPSGPPKEHSLQEFRDKVDSLLTCVSRQNVLAEASAVLLQQLKAYVKQREKNSKALLANAVHAGLQSLCRLVMNLYCFASEGTSATALRQSLLVSTPLANTLLPLYTSILLDEMGKCVDLEKGRVAHPPPPIVLNGLTVGLRCLSFASFHMGVHTLPLRRSNTFTATLLSYPKEFAVANLTALAALLHYNINIDSFAGEHGLEDDLPETCRSACILRGASQLVSLLDTDTIHKLWSLVERSGGQTPLAKDNVSFDILSHLIEVTAQHRDEATPKSARNTGATMDEESLEAVTAKLDERMASLEEYREELAGVRQELRTPAVTPASPPLEAKPDLRLLGNLPTVSQSYTKPLDAPIDIKSTRRLKRPESREGLSRPSKAKVADDVPQEFRCAINGHLLRNPVRAPSGDVFEKETIDMWLSNQGSTNPISGGPLSAEDLKPDTELMARIMEWQIKQSLTANNPADADDDLYAF